MLSSTEHEQDSCSFQLCCSLSMIDRTVLSSTREDTEIKGAMTKIFLACAKILLVCTFSLGILDFIVS